MCRNPDFTFEKEEYAYIHTGPETSCARIIFIHDICYTEEPDVEKCYYLVVSKYSFCKSTSPFRELQQLDGKEINDKELILHFEDFNRMGMRDDAEAIPLGDITMALAFDSGSEVVSHISPDPSSEIFWHRLPYFES